MVVAVVVGCCRIKDSSLVAFRQKMGRWSLGRGAGFVTVTHPVAYPRCTVAPFGTTGP